MRFILPLLFLVLFSGRSLSQCVMTINLNISNATDSSNCDGFINANVFGNNGPVTYSWICNSCQTSFSSSLGGLCYGSSGNVIATDSNGCTVTASWTIGLDPCADFGGMLNSVPASTTGNCDGSISFTPLGGTAPYVYSISNGSNTYTSNNPSGLCAGTYTVSATDANGCNLTTIETVSVDSCINLSLNFNNVVNTSSSASCDGSASAIINGGSAPYTYLWNNAMTTPNADSLCSGTYSVCITDMNGCQVCDSITISDSSFVDCSSLAGILNVTNVSASGLCDGSISATVNGGTLPYVYYWNTGSTSSSVNNLCEGLYVVDVIDANGCSLNLTDVIGSSSGSSGDTIVINGGIIIDSTAIDSVYSGWIDNCNFDFTTISNAFIDSYFDMTDSTIISWILEFNDGSVDTLNVAYQFSTGTSGVFNIVLQLFCGQKSNPKWLIAYDQMYYQSTASINPLNMNHLSIYPNPAREFINIDGLNENEFYEIIDQMGRIILSKSNSKVINISTLSKGIYTLKHYNLNGNQSIRFVKE